MTDSVTLNPTPRQIAEARYWADRLDKLTGSSVRAELMHALDKELPGVVTVIKWVQELDSGGHKDYIPPPFCGDDSHAEYIVRITDTRVQCLRCDLIEEMPLDPDEKFPPLPERTFASMKKMRTGTAIPQNFWNTAGTAPPPPPPIPVSPEEYNGPMQPGPGNDVSWT